MGWEWSVFTHGLCNYFLAQEARETAQGVDLTLPLLSSVTWTSCRTSLGFSFKMGPAHCSVFVSNPVHEDNWLRSQHPHHQASLHAPCRDSQPTLPANCLRVWPTDPFPAPQSSVPTLLLEDEHCWLRTLPQVPSEAEANTEIYRKGWYPSTSPVLSAGWRASALPGWP